MWHCKASVGEVVENLEADAFFLFTYWEYQMTEVQKDMFSFKNNGGVTQIF